VGSDGPVLPVNDLVHDPPTNVSFFSTYLNRSVSEWILPGAATPIDKL
jgi:hypothetical protein